MVLVCSQYPRNCIAFGYDNSSESGFSAGISFVLNTYTDGGAFLTTPFSLNRASGNLLICRGLVAGTEIA